MGMEQLKYGLIWDSFYQIKFLELCVEGEWDTLVATVFCIAASSIIVDALSL